MKKIMLLLAVVAALNLLAEGEPKMPMLNWMGRDKVVKQDKEVLLKIRREDKSMGHLSHAERPWRFAPCRRQRREDIPHLARPPKGANDDISSAACKSKRGFEKVNVGLVS